MQQTSVLRLLAAHRPHDDTERDFLARILRFVRETPGFHRRDTAQGHLTASAWIVDAERRHALLLHHGKLGRWLQPGGHIEDDASLLDSALREALEETGLRCRPVDGGIFDIDIHPIPARGPEPAHLHYDVRFLLEADAGARPEVSPESNAVRWFALEEIAALEGGPSIGRMVEKTRPQPPA
ncbi:MAG: NUDIX hydrolase [Gammaproteobacteria bacterium]|nr:NUDIX hydrolase [Gammaproteobacteria bacterium]